MIAFASNTVHNHHLLINHVLHRGLAVADAFEIMVINNDLHSHHLSINHYFTSWISQLAVANALEIIVIDNEHSNLQNLLWSTEYL